MVKIKIDITKSIFENIQDIYDKAKKLKKKENSLLEKIEETKKKLELVDTELYQEYEKIERKFKKEWYEKFRWFFTSSGHLVIGGKDAITNEILIKKYLEKEDIVFHADIKGSPFVILKVKTSNNPITEDILKEVAQFTVSYSRAWKLGYSSLDCYYVKPEQISKKAPSGEYLPKGSFMIYGKKNYFYNVKLELAIGVNYAKNKIYGGPESAIKKYTDKYVLIIPGDIKPLELSKKIGTFLNFRFIEDIQSFIPGPSFLLSKK